MPTKQAAVQAINFKAALVRLGSWTIVRLPENASAQLPSRGQVMAEGIINGVSFKTPLEPDGRWGHWFRPDNALLKAIGATAGDTVTLQITPTKNWPEPDIPADLQKALKADPKAHGLWQKVTPMARWEWMRWIRSTGKNETRQKRIQVAMSKLEAGKRRPCCWNRNACTEPSVSKNGILLDPDLPH